MNKLHQVLCASRLWAGHLRGQVPWVIGSFDLGHYVLEIGPGYGPTTTALAETVPHVTALEADDELANRLQGRWENATVLHGDGTTMPLDDASCSGVVCFTMLHHLPSAQLQNRLFTEAYRVLRPGESSPAATAAPARPSDSSTCPTRSRRSTPTHFPVG